MTDCSGYRNMDQNSGVQIITFQITPYSDSIANYINSLSEEQIYSIFRENVAADILTAALYAIYKLESAARNIIKNQENSKMEGSYKKISSKVLESLADVYLRDQLLFGENINDLVVYPNVFVLIVNGMYSGHIYAWTIENSNGAGRVTNVIGIRTSLYQLMIDTSALRQSGVAPIFLNAIQTWALNEDNRLVREAAGKREVNINPHYLRVLQPIGPMPGILGRCGFVVTKSIRNQQDKEWLFNNGSVGDTALALMLIFRESDYIIQLVNEL